MWRIFKEKLFTCSHFGLKYNLCRHKSPLEWGCGEWQQVEYTVPVSTKILCMISKGDSFAVYCIFQMATLIAGCKQNTRQISIHTPIHMQKGCRWMSFLSQRCFTLSSCYLIFWLQNKSCILFFAFNIGDNPACWKERQRKSLWTRLLLTLPRCSVCVHSIVDSTCWCITMTRELLGGRSQALTQVKISLLCKTKEILNQIWVPFSAGGFKLLHTSSATVWWEAK